MEKKQIVCEYKIYDSIIELPEEYRQVLEAAISAADSSYSPYSGFSVGAAIKLGNGVIVKGSNQENAAYPSGLCAERTAMFYASATYPGVPMLVLAIAAKKNGELTKEITVLQAGHERVPDKRRKAYGGYNRQCHKGFRG